MFRNARNFCIVMASLAAGGVLASAARAASISNGNTTVTFNTSDTTGTVPWISQWIVDGVDQYGGTPAGGESPGYYLGAFAETNVNSSTLLSSNFSGPVASALFQGDGYTIAVKDIVSGGLPGSGASAINETFTFNNTGTSPLTVAFVDFVNPNVNATPTDDTLTLSSNTASQTDPSGTVVNFSVTPTPAIVGSTVDGGLHYFSTGPGVFTGDVGFYFLWSTADGSGLTIGAGDSMIYSINETVTGVPSGTGAAMVPLPNSAWTSLVTLAGLGGIGLVRRMRKTAA
jgi:hypothetical protein